MDSQMKKDILASMEKNMPKQMGGLLLKRMEELEKIEKEGSVLFEQNAKLIKRNEVLEYKDRKDYDLTEREKNCSMREKALILEDHKRDISNLNTELQIKSAEEKVNLINNLVGLLMKNPSAITTINQTDFSDSSWDNNNKETRHKIGHLATIQTAEEK